MGRHLWVSVCSGYRTITVRKFMQVGRLWSRVLWMPLFCSWDLRVVFLSHQTQKVARGCLGQC